MKEYSSKGLLYTLATSVFAIINLLFIDYAYQIDEKLTPIEFVYWGFTGNALFSSFFVLSQKRYYPEILEQIRYHWRFHFGIALITIVASYLFFIAVSTTSAGLISVFERSNILFTLILGAFFLREIITKKDLIFMSLVILGFMMLSNLSGEITPFTVVVILISSFLYSIQSLLVKKYAGGLDSTILAYIRGVLITILAVLLIYLGFAEFRILSFWPMFYVVTSQIIGIFICRILYFEAHKYIGIGLIHMFLLSVPVGTMFFGILLFKDPVSLQKILGSALVVFGLGILYFFHRK